MEPTIEMAILAFIVSFVFAAAVLIFGVLLLAESWRTRKGHTQNEYAYKARENNYEVKFITGGRK